jgi:hypothetical protein
MLRLCALLAPIAPTPELQRSLNTNATKLESYFNTFPARFIKEGENCLSLSFRKFDNIRIPNPLPGTTPNGSLQNYSAAVTNS